MTKNKNNYKDSGVNIEEGQKFIDDIKTLTANTSQKYSLSNIGSFSGYVEIPSDYGDSPYIISNKLINSGKENLLLNSKIKINCPVHLLHGGQDADVPIETSLKIMEQIESGDVKLTLVKSANHQFSEQKNLKLIFDSINEMIN